MENVNVEMYWDKITGLVIQYGGKIIIAIIIWIIGLLFVNLLVKLIDKGMQRSKMELTVRKFVLSLIGFGLKVLLFVTCASIVGIKMTAFVTIIGAMGLAFGLALQGSLANFAGGVLLNILKPYKIGDFIETNGIMGTVKEISIFNTILNTPDNKRIILPNSSVSNGNITNFSTEKTRRVDLSFGVDYSTDMKKAIEIIKNVATQHNKVLSEPAPFVRIGKFSESSIDITVRIWANSEDYWDVYFDMLENVKNEFDKAGITIPFNQIDVNLKK